MKSASVPGAYDSHMPAASTGSRKRGWRVLRVSVPNPDDPAFIAEARRQSLAVANSPYAIDDQDFVDAMMVAEGNEAR